MADMDKATRTQIANIQQRTGRSMEALFDEVRASGKVKHGEMRDHLKSKLGMGHGDANLVVHLYRQGADAAGLAASGGGSSPAPGAAAVAGPVADAADPLDAIYAGPKAALRPIHDRLMEGIGSFGDLEVAPKKAYVSLRRKKQFATLGPATKTRFEVGLNMKGVPATDRLLALPPGGMCQYKVNVTDPAEVDAELLAWIRTAYDAAG